MRKTISTSIRVSGDGLEAFKRASRSPRSGFARGAALPEAAKEIREAKRGAVE